MGAFTLTGQVSAATVYFRAAAIALSQPTVIVSLAHDKIKTQ